MNIKDYLHLYLGCEVEIEQRYTGGPNTTRKATFLGFTDARRTAARTGFRAGPEGVVGLGLNVLKPILRPLSDMTKEEAIWMTELRHGKGCVGVRGDWAFDAPTRTVIWSNEFGGELQVAMKGIGTRYAPNRKGIHYMPSQFLYLLSKNFDLFGLIEAGLAIDRTKLNSDKNPEVSDTTESASNSNAD